MDFYNFHPDKMGLVEIEYLNKSSTLFFCFLLENHPEIIASFYTGYLNPEKSLKKNLAKYVYEKIIGDNTVKQYMNKYFPFTCKQFEKPFNEYVDKFGVSRKTVFIAIHYAVAKLLKRDLKKIKFILYHHHDVTKIKKLNRDFKKFRLIVTVRDPRASLWSQKKALRFPICFDLFEPLFIMGAVNKIKKEKKLFVRHEDLHLEPVKTMKKVCSFLGIKYNSAVLTATNFGAEWTGSNRQGKVLSVTKVTSSKPNKLFVKDDWKESLSKTELFFIQVFLGKVMKIFNYLKYKKIKKESAKIDYDYEGMLKIIFWFMRNPKNMNSLIKIYKKLENVFVLGFLMKKKICFLIFLVSIYNNFKRSFSLMFS